MNDVEEYTDEQTGIRLTVERDDPDWPRLTVYLPDGCTFTTEEMNEAIHRLARMAGYEIYDETFQQWVRREA